ncbi:nuclear pore complex-interacting protein family member B13-like [Zingiber officinale]|uniref:nuclear pore complex-interacting protein family member B13-like n=1 Tax=Zingiber officinale TaxID=94328 RepID=UPI001C4CEAEC|nr:nuclear pore complex-interacting protein family member B13-like [Zingiber officinale]
MSRCFPYPPPYFGQAEIESIKLLKEEKAKKHNEKAKRQKSHQKEKSLNSNHDGKQHKKRKHQEKSEDERSHKKQKSEKKQLPLVSNLCSQKTNERIEQLEKSGLTEEHEHPCSIQHKLDSPESSQDSSKRRKLVLSSIHETQGSTLRIKLPSFRQRAVEPSPLPLSRQTEPQPPPLSRQTELQPPFPPSGQVELASPSSRQIKPQPAPSTSAGKVKLPPASSRQIKPQPSLPQSKLGKIAVSRQIKVQTQLLPSDQVDSTVPLLPPSRRVELPLPLSRQTKLQPPLPPSRQVEQAMPLPRQKLQPPVPPSRRVEQAMPLPRQKLQPPLPKPEPVELARPLPTQTKQKPPLLPTGQVRASLLSSSKQTTLQQQVPLPTQICPQPLDLKTEKLRLDKKPAAVTEQPCSSSRPSEAASAAATTKSSRKKRVGGRTWQKEQYEILVANWNPPAAMERFETSARCEDDDWLAAAPRQQRCPAKDSTASNATGSIQENHAVPSVQPLACYLPEFNMYQLPYVVPF